jgi:Fe-S-cluster containining protein
MKTITAHAIIALFVMVCLAGCMDQDPFGLTTRDIQGAYELEQWEDGSTYYLRGPSHLSHEAWGAIEGTVGKLGWSGDIILVWQNDCGHRLATGLETTHDEIVTKYLARNEDGDLTFNRRPCPFLAENRCRVYEHRPDTCRSYPHLQKEEFVFRLAQAVSNCSICPISFNVFERLKTEIWHRRRGVGEDNQT